MFKLDLANLIRKEHHILYHRNIKIAEHKN
jgi:hypothetical protein